MRPLSEPTRKIVGQNCSRKYISLGRIISQWEEIVGSDFADKAQPVKLNYQKSKDTKKPKACLEIACSSAHATTMHYQKGVILERLNRIFSDAWITDIKFVTSNLVNRPPEVKKSILPLTEKEKKYLSDMLEDIQDDEIKQRLEKLGREILTKAKS